MTNLRFGQFQGDIVIPIGPIAYGHDSCGDNLTDVSLTDYSQQSLPLKMPKSDLPAQAQTASQTPRFETGPLLANAKDWERTPFFEWMGMRVLHATDGHARLVLDVQDHHRGGGGTDAVNGGVLAYLLDAVVGLATHSSNPLNTAGQVTLSLNVEYMAPMMVATQVVGEGEVVRRGGNLAFVDGRLYGDDGNVACRAHAVMRIFRQRN